MNSAPENIPARFINKDGTLNTAMLLRSYLEMERKFCGGPGDKNLFAITDDFIIPADWCLKELDRGFTVDMLDRDAGKFIRYWSTKGNRKTLLGWKKAWANWLNRSVG